MKGDLSMNHFKKTLEKKEFKNFCNAHGTRAKENKHYKNRYLFSFLISITANFVKNLNKNAIFYYEKIIKFITTEVKRIKDQTDNVAFRRLLVGQEFLKSLQYRIEEVEANELPELINDIH